MKLIKGLVVVLFVIFTMINGYTYKIADVDKTVKISALHLYINPISANSVSLTYSLFINYQGKEKTNSNVIEISIPKNVSNFEFLAGVNKQNVNFNQNKMIIKANLKPGENNIVIRMLKQINLPHFILPLKINKFTENIYILTPPSGIKIKGEDLYEGKEVEIQNNKLKYYFYPKLFPNMELSLFVNIKSETTSQIIDSYQPKFHSAAHVRFWRQSPFRGINPHIFLAILTILPISLFIYLKYKKRKKASNVEDINEQLKLLNLRKESLLEEIVNLDEKFANNKIDEKTYKEMRSKAKERLSKIQMNIERLKN
ncbi:hypothetical protein FHQ18_11335 [Deferribacter autotrophicus]|uniref:Uncharacterized protein n=1 Tax=Deferribacter autotrophicus TaxID=500465 RepID=A0A5A8F3U3_9BACT|nr:hypothetical protein [Deferribacter autotrophicus]KAA0257154.1 hypothetical protein FHQ18_11335 [Deferribacter autotrophicus]